MENTDFVTQLREHYVAQFIDFVEHQQKDSAKGASEVKLKLSDKSGIFDHLYCVDFIKNEPTEIVELQPENILVFDPISGGFGQSSLLIEHLRWDDVIIYHDADNLPEDQLSQWFTKWFDPQDIRYNADNQVGEVIHSLVIEPHSVSIDFGTSQPTAFWDMLAILESAKTTSMRITSSSAENPVDP
ncbi:MAG: hypothetical protein ABJF89_06925 [Parasphingorhabdus sp.]|uniref:hypothetical protein n=2 Tax=Parasphingorhabdus sp. TaxID=2709688 RepID=UPI003265EFA8